MTSRHCRIEALILVNLFPCCEQGSIIHSACMLRCHIFRNISVFDRIRYHFVYSFFPRRYSLPILFLYLSFLRERESDTSEARMSSEEQGQAMDGTRQARRSRGAEDEDSLALSTVDEGRVGEGGLHWLHIRAG